MLRGAYFDQLVNKTVLNWFMMVEMLTKVCIPGALYKKTDFVLILAVGRVRILCNPEADQPMAIKSLEVRSCRPLKYLHLKEWPSDSI